jgi:hypothetical protein
MARRQFVISLLGILNAIAVSFWPGAAESGLTLRFPAGVWQVDDLESGKKGFGLTVLQGTRIERFEIEVLGVLKNISPGRDMVLVRCSGCDLERTGVIAGMSGSPIYVDGRLVGALAYAWPFGKEPIAGVTPFTQMLSFADLAQRSFLKPPPVVSHPLSQSPFAVGHARDGSVIVHNPLARTESNVVVLAPVQTPLAMAGFSPRVQQFLCEQLGSGVTPVPVGAPTARLRRLHAGEPLRPGSPLSAALIMGDFDLSGIGTVTEVRGERVWGWGHPFLGLGSCELPLLFGYVHTVMPRQTVSFKMGSPLQLLGTLQADVSTGIAGRLGKGPALLPVEVKVARDQSGSSQEFRCQLARHRHLTPQLVQAVLGNSLDSEGELPEELTADLEVVIDLEGHPPLLMRDRLSGPGYSGSRAPLSLFTPIAGIVHALLSSPYGEVRIRGLSASVRLFSHRTSADLEAVQLVTEILRPGETLRVEATLRPYQRPVQRVRLELPLPEDLPDGTYTAIICDDLSHAKAVMRDSPHLSDPPDQAHWLSQLRLLCGVQRQNLLLRVPVPEAGVVVAGQALLDLPGSMVEILGSSRRTGTATVVQRCLCSKTPTNWVIQSGSHSVKFTVSRASRVQRTWD